MAGVEDIARTSGVKIDQVRNVFEAVLQLANQGQRIGVHGFGTFQRRERAGRTITTPMLNNGEPTVIAPAYSLAFRPSALAKHRLNVSAKKSKAGKGEAKPPPGSVAADFEHYTPFFGGGGKKSKAGKREAKSVKSKKAAKKGKRR